MGPRRLQPVKGTADIRSLFGAKGGGANGPPIPPAGPPKRAADGEDEGDARGKRRVTSTDTEGGASNVTGQPIAAPAPVEQLSFESNAAWLNSLRAEQARALNRTLITDRCGFTRGIHAISAETQTQLAELHNSRAPGRSGQWYLDNSRCEIVNLSTGKVGHESHPRVQVSVPLTGEALNPSLTAVLAAVGDQALKGLCSLGRAGPTATGAVLSQVTVYFYVLITYLSILFLQIYTQVVVNFTHC